jgi:hypothetical protein
VRLETLIQAVIYLAAFVSVPRWTEILLTIDHPVAAFFTGLLIEMASVFLSLAHDLTGRAKRVYKAEWERHAQLMKDQEKKNRRPQEAPELEGSGKLIWLFVGLMGIEIVVQSPFYYGKVAGQTIAQVLEGWPLWVWAILLVLATSLITFSLTLASQYIGAAKAILGKEPKRERSEIWEALRVRVVNWVAGDVPDRSAETPEKSGKMRKAEFLEGVRSGLYDVNVMTGNDIAELANVDPRTGRNWLVAAKELAGKGNGHHA